MATNFVISSCPHDPNRQNFCKNWNGTGNIGDVIKERVCPKEIIKKSADNEEPIVDFAKCPFHVIGNINIGDPT